MGVWRVRPYYEQDGITIYHGHCLSVMDALHPDRGPRPCYDLLLTDPPYGIGEAAGKNVSRSKLAVSADYGHAMWDDRTASVEITAARQLCRWQIVFGGNYYALPPSSCWLVWDKENGASDFADCELAWTNLKKAVRKLTYRWNGMLQQPGRPKEQREHPTQKPEPVMVWALQNAPHDVRTVFDPFMGSGTTLVAAKRLGRRAIGIEINERYCEIAARRLAQRALSFDVSA